MLWDHLTSTDIAAIDRRTPVVLPMAATEQHGPHLPLATDRLIADHFAAALDLALGDEVLILPTVAVGCSAHHMAFPGTLSLSHESFRTTVLDILESVRTHGFRNFFLLNAHGGNQAIGGVILEQFGHAHPDVSVAFASWWQVAREALMPLNASGPGGAGHACEFETALMLKIAPQLVHLDRIPQKSNLPTYPWAEGDMLRGAKASLFRDMRAMTPTGAYGEPSAGSAELGNAITTAVIDALSPILMDLKQ